MRFSLTKDGQAAHAGAREDANLGLVHALDDIVGEARVHQRLVARDERVLEAVVHAARVLLVDDALVVKVGDLRGELGGEVGGVEAVDHLDPRGSREELVVELVVVVAEAGHEAHAGDHDALLGVGLAGHGGDDDGCFRMGDDGAERQSLRSRRKRTSASPQRNTPRVDLASTRGWDRA